MSEIYTYVWQIMAFALPLLLYHNIMKRKMFKLNHFKVEISTWWLFKEKSYENIL